MNKPNYNYHISLALKEEEFNQMKELTKNKSFTQIGIFRAGLDRCLKQVEVLSRKDK